MMAKASARFAELAFVLLRVVAGLAFAQHGVQKLFGLLGGNGVPLVSLMGLAGAIELVCGLLIALGLFTRWAAFIASGEMAFAYFMRHAPAGFFPIQNRGELAVLYCFIFLYIAARGGGRWSLGRD
jgi:putative oxidoreductase